MDNKKIILLNIIIGILIVAGALFVVSSPQIDSKEIINLNGFLFNVPDGFEVVGGYNTLIHNSSYISMMKTEETGVTSIKIDITNSSLEYAKDVAQGEYNFENKNINNKNGFFGEGSYYTYFIYSDKNKTVSIEITAENPEDLLNNIIL